MRLLRCALITAFNLGTVWVLDQKPREMTSGEAEMLKALAALAMNQMEPRLYAQDVARLERIQRTIAEGVEAEIGNRFFLIAGAQSRAGVGGGIRLCHPAFR